MYLSWLMRIMSGVNANSEAMIEPTAPLFLSKGAPVHSAIEILAHCVLANGPVDQWGRPLNLRSWLGSQEGPSNSRFKHGPVNISTLSSTHINKWWYHVDNFRGGNRRGDPEALERKHHQQRPFPFSVQPQSAS